MSKKKTYTSREVSKIVQRRTKELRSRLNDLKAENATLREILITAFKEWFEEQERAKEEKEND